MPAHRAILHAAAARLREPSSGLFVLLVVVGMTLRVARYLDNRSLWLDEAFLALNLTGKSTSELLGSLDFVQTAPAGFLLLEKGVVSLLGDSEYALRLVPLLASLGAVVLFAFVARRLLAPPVALLALLLYALHPRLHYFASELKPYSLDVAVALLVLLLTLRALERPPGGLRSLAPLGIAGVVVVWFSFPAIFTLGGAALVLGVEELRARRGKPAVVVAALSGLWLASLFASYSVAAQNVSNTAEALFGGGSPEGVRRLASLAQKSWALLVDPGGFVDGTNGLAALLILVGLLAWASRDRYSLLLVVSPIALAVVAEAVGRYPLGGRFSLFLVPSLLLLVAAGIGAAVRHSRLPVLTAILLSLFVSAPSVGRAGYGLVAPTRSEDVRPLLAHVAQEWRSDDTLFVYRNAQYAVRYYATCEDCNPVAGGFPWPTRLAPPAPDGEQFAPALESIPPTVVVGEAGQTMSELLAQAARLPAGRVWLLFSHVSAGHGVDERALLLRALDARGRKLEGRTGDGAALYLYRLDPVED